jgi:hypothetical protein
VTGFWGGLWPRPSHNQSLSGSILIQLNRELHCGTCPLCHGREVRKSISLLRTSLKPSPFLNKHVRL